MAKKSSNKPLPHRTPDDPKIREIPVGMLVDLPPGKYKVVFTQSMLGYNNETRQYELRTYMRHVDDPDLLTLKKGEL